MRLLSLLEGDGERQRLRGTVSRVGPSGVTTVALARGARLPTGKALCVQRLHSGRHPRAGSGTWAVGPSVMALFREAALQGLHKGAPAKSTLCPPRGFGRGTL